MMAWLMMIALLSINSVGISILMVMVMEQVLGHLLVKSLFRIAILVST